MKVLKGVKRVRDRDIIRVEVDGVIQPFYKSTGRNSEHAGTWYPFDGIYIMYGHVRWFDKRRFVCGAGGKYHRVAKEHQCFHRYGTKEFKRISAVLAGCPIPEGDVSCPFVVNDWLGYVNPFKDVEAPVI